MYKCMKCGKAYEGLPTNPDGRISICSCGSRMFLKVRPQRVKRVRAI